MKNPPAQLSIFSKTILTSLSGVSFRILIAVFIGIIFINEAYAQPATSSSTNQDESSASRGVMYGPTHNTGSTSIMPPQNTYPPQPRCYEEQKFWQEGRWEFPHGKRIWVPGQWVMRQVVVPCPTPPPPPSHPSHHHHHDSPPPTNSTNFRNCEAPTMSPTQFTEAVQTVQNRSFDNTKMEVVRQIVSNNCLTSMQIRYLMMTLTFESNRLELAKQAYAFTCDRYNYYMVNDAFSFDVSVRELGEFIKKQGH